MNAILTRDLAATNHRPARVVATDADGNRAVVSADHYDRASDAHRAAAVALAKKIGRRGWMIAGETVHGWAFVWVDVDLHGGGRVTARGTQVNLV